MAIVSGGIGGSIGGEYINERGAYSGAISSANYINEPGVRITVSLSTVSFSLSTVTSTLGRLWGVTPSTCSFNLSSINALAVCGHGAPFSTSSFGLSASNATRIYERCVPFSSISFNLSANNVIILRDQKVPFSTSSFGWYPSNASRVYNRVAAISTNSFSFSSSSSILTRTWNSSLSSSPFVLSPDNISYIYERRAPLSTASFGVISSIAPILRSCYVNFSSSSFGFSCSSGILELGLQTLLSPYSFHLSNNNGLLFFDRNSVLATNVFNFSAESLLASTLSNIAYYPLLDTAIFNFSPVHITVKRVRKSKLAAVSFHSSLVNSSTVYGLTSLLPGASFGFSPVNVRWLRLDWKSRLGTAPFNFTAENAETNNIINADLSSTNFNFFTSNVKLKLGLRTGFLDVPSFGFSPVDIVRAKYGLKSKLGNTSFDLFIGDLLQLNDNYAMLLTAPFNFDPADTKLKRAYKTGFLDVPSFGFSPVDLTRSKLGLKSKVDTTHFNFQTNLAYSSNSFPYNISLSVGTFTFAPVNVKLKWGRKSKVGSSNFGLTGETSSLIVGRRIDFYPSEFNFGLQDVDADATGQPIHISEDFDTAEFSFYPQASDTVHGTTPHESLFQWYRDDGTILGVGQHYRQTIDDEGHRIFVAEIPVGENLNFGPVAYSDPTELVQPVGLEHTAAAINHLVSLAAVSFSMRDRDLYVN